LSTKVYTFFGTHIENNTATKKPATPPAEVNRQPAMAEELVGHHSMAPAI
jgi:hypothetical protein